MLIMVTMEKMEMLLSLRGSFLKILLNHMVDKTMVAAVKGQ